VRLESTATPVARATVQPDMSIATDIAPDVLETLPHAIPEFLSVESSPPIHSSPPLVLRI
jgi:hypothetical protein